MMRSLRIFRSRRHPRRGQAIVLGAVSVLVLALALFMTMGISWNVKEKIRVQNAADAQAYSQAIRVARAFNYFAYTNRSMAGAIVSMTMMHAFHSEITASADLMFIAALAQFQMAGCEFGICCSCPWGACCKFNHCIHGIKDILSGVKLIGKWSKHAKDVRALENPFRSAINSLKTMIQLIQTSQTLVRTSLMLDMISGNAVPLKNLNIPAGNDSTPMMLGMINLSQFNSALDTGSSGSSLNKKKRDMGDVVNSARPQWVKNRYLAIQSSALLQPLAQKIRSYVQGNWFIVQAPFGIGGRAGFDAKKPPTVLTPILMMGQPKPGQQPKYVSSTDWWTLGGSCKHGCCGGGGMLPLLGLVMPSVLASGQGSGIHKPTFIQKGHSGSHSLDINALVKFTNYKIKTSGRYAQPVMFGYAEQNLSRDEQGKKLPWDITQDGRVSASLTGTGNLTMTNTQTSRSIAKALVYYHHPGNWKEPPNFWNPFWRAKLHPFGNTEAMIVAGMAGDTAAASAAIFGVGTASGSAAMSAF